MKPTANPGRCKRPELQDACEAGFDQEHDDDCFVLLDRFGRLLKVADSCAAGAERKAATLEGAADAPHALARARRADLPTLRAIGRAGL